MEIVHFSKDFKRVPTEKVNTPSEDRTRWERIDIDLRSESPAVSIRSKDENTIAMYGLSKSFTIKFSSTVVSNILEYFETLFFFSLSTMANGICANLLPSGPT